MNKETFVKLAKEKYGDAFIYDHLPELITRVAEVIICRKHGEIRVIPRDHLRTKYGCPHCASEGASKSEVAYNEEMIEKAKKKYGDKFDYNEVDLGTKKEMQVKLRCPEHGQFSMSLRRHLHSKYGCPGCGHDNSVAKRRKYRSLTDISTKVREIHGDKYECLHYDSGTRILKYRCFKHGEIARPLAYLLDGRGCPDCGYEGRTITTEEFLSRAKEVHPEGYSYELSELQTVNHKITISHQCGHVYKGRVSNHLSGQGCMRCKVSLGEEKIAKFLEFNNVEFIPQYRVSKDNRYRYDFYLPDLGILIEYDGEQHFRPVDYFGGVTAFEETKRRDREKNEIAKCLGYKLIRVSYKKFDTLEDHLSRAIDRYFKYRVSEIFYRNFVSLCNVLNLPDNTTTRCVEHYRTFRTLLSPPSQ